MPISTSATDRSRPRGFTLLEVLVVVTLLALFAAVVLPMLGRTSNTDDLAFQSSRLRDVMQQLAENSMFRGQMLALRLDPTSYTPMRYDTDEQSFVAITDEKMLASQSLPENYLLEWSLTEQEDPQQQTLATAAQQQLLAGKQVDKDTLPQLYFFPSGEVTPLQVIMRDSGKGREVRLKMDALGRITLGDDNDKAVDADASP